MDKLHITGPGGVDLKSAAVEKCRAAVSKLQDGNKAAFMEGKAPELVVHERWIQMPCKSPALDHSAYLI